MTNPIHITRLIMAGIGPGNPQHITLEAIDAAISADKILVPRSQPETPGIAETVIRAHIPGKTITPIIFPMTRNLEHRRKIILSQLKFIAHELFGRTIFFPVIGDVTLYSTAYYALEALREIFPDIDTVFIPGISAHSLAASCARTFLAMSDETLTVIPGTASDDKISKALKYSDNVAIYKPSANPHIAELIRDENFATIIRVDHAGNPERERIYEGLNALYDIEGEYMSVILLHR